MLFECVKMRDILIALLVLLIIGTVDANCKETGCPPKQICMGNGDCTTLSVREYCESHGVPLYTYNDALLTRDCSKELIVEEQRLCQQCKGEYGLNKSMENIKWIVYSIAAGIAVLILIANGITLMTSEDASERDNAKRAMLYVILGLSIILVGVNLVVYLWG